MSSEKQCIICYEEKQNNDFEFLPCLHDFCHKCISKITNKKCPLCREPFAIEEKQYSTSAPSILISTTTQSEWSSNIQEAETQRRRRRRRRRTPNGNGRRRRERDNHLIFTLDEDEIIYSDSDRDDTHLSVNNSHYKRENGENWMRLNSQRSRYSRR